MITKVIGRVGFGEDKGRDTDFRGLERVMGFFHFDKDFVLEFLGDFIVLGETLVKGLVSFDVQGGSRKALHGR